MEIQNVGVLCIGVTVHPVGRLPDFKGASGGEAESDHRRDAAAMGAKDREPRSPEELLGREAGDSCFWCVRLLDIIQTLYGFNELSSIFLAWL